MAGYTSKPRGGGLSRFAPAPSYSGVAARYAADFTAALNEEKKLELNAKILEYQNGSLSFKDLKSYMEGKISSEGKNTAWGQTLTSNLMSLSKSENEKQVSNKQTELLKKYGEGGLTNAEQLAINLELQNVAEPNSEVAQKLIAQEVSIRGQMATEAKNSMGTNSREGLDAKLSQVDYNVKRIDDLYASGKITGAQRDASLAEEFQTAAQAVTEARSSGANISKEEYTNYVYGSQYFAENLQKRNAGEIVDVEGKDGKIVPVTIDMLKQDAQSSNPKYTNSFNSYSFSNVTGKINIVDKITGEPKTDKNGNPLEFNSVSEARAELLRLYKPGTFELRAISTNGERDFWTFDKEKEAFKKIDGVNWYKTVPQTNDEINKYKMTAPTPTEFKSDEVYDGKSKSGPTMQPSFGEQAFGFAKDIAKGLPLIGPGIGALDSVYKANQPNTQAGNPFMDSVNPVKPVYADYGPQDLPGGKANFDFKMPEFKLPSFDLPNIPSLTPRPSQPSTGVGAGGGGGGGGSWGGNTQSSSWYQPILDTLSSGISSVRNFLKI